MLNYTPFSWQNSQNTCHNINSLWREKVAYFKMKKKIKKIPFDERPTIKNDK